MVMQTPLHPRDDVNNVSRKEGGREQAALR